MNKSHTAYIAIGSNKGDKFKNLQLALDAIHEKVGRIIAISKVYLSKAIGFDGDDFYNGCIGVETFMEPDQLLETLLDIETDLGRTRLQTKTYESRSIDLDIVLFDDAVVKTKALQYKCNFFRCGSANPSQRVTIYFCKLPRKNF